VKTLQEIATHLEGTLIGDPTLQLKGVASLGEAGHTDISFLLEKKHKKKALAGNALALITYEKLDEFPNQIVVKFPRKALAQTIALFHAPSPTHPGISKHASVHPTAKISPLATIDPFVTIQDHVEIGPHTHIKSGTLIEAHSTIGHHSTIGANVSILHHTQIGNHVKILSGAVIGEEGFGFYKENGMHHKIPHISTVIIEDNVEIGANTCIDRGLLAPTKISKGTKIDNLVQVGHNVQIDENCIIVAQVGLVGSSHIKSGVTIGGQVGIDAVTIGHNAIVASKSGVTKDISDNDIVSGFPAQSHMKELQDKAVLNQLIKRERHKREETT